MLDMSDISNNIKICQHLYHASNTMKNKNPLWDLEGREISKIFYPTLEPSTNVENREVKFTDNNQNSHSNFFKWILKSLDYD